MCGRLRYAARDPIDAGYCHCRMCQRSSGAPVLAWVSFPVAAFAWEAGAPSVYQSSDRGQREFCPSCGTQLVFRDNMYWTTQNDGSQTGPYCSRCWDADGKLVRILSFTDPYAGPRFQCSFCKTDIPRED